MGQHSYQLSHLSRASKYLLRAYYALEAKTLGRNMTSVLILLEGKDKQPYQHYVDKAPGVGHRASLRPIPLPTSTALMRAPCREQARDEH